MMMHDNNIVSV